MPLWQFPYLATITDTTFGNYTYNKDILTNFNGKSIGYNSNGELHTYDGKTYSWNKGRIGRILEIGAYAASIFFAYSKISCAEF